jgi:hypothetical protein
VWGAAATALVAASVYAAWAFGTPVGSPELPAAHGSSTLHHTEQGTVFAVENVAEVALGGVSGSRAKVAAPERAQGSGSAPAGGESASLPPRLTRRVSSNALKQPADPAPPPAAEDFQRMPDFEGAGNEAEAELGKYIQSVVRREMAPLAYSCLAVRFEQDPAIEDTVEIRLVVSGDGKVGGVVLEAKLTERSTLTDAAEIDCIEQSALTLAFAAPPKGHENITIVYPMVLSSRWMHQRAREGQNAEHAR